ncbi:MAG: hypothetical protein ACI4MC_06615 [Candidatus Coproplasma sp.]
MLCQNCRRREATQNHTAIINGKPFEYHLCERCASEMFGGFEASFAQGIANGLFDEPFVSESICPACGMSFSEFQRTGLLGCPSCYDVFREELMPYVAKIQGKTAHVGKGGGVNTAEHETRLELARLQKAMESALANGDYILAEKINRQMNSIRKRNGG